MALSGLDIYKLLPKTNCRKCGFATCLAFAMALAQKKASLDKCPDVAAAAREALESASRPPIKLVTVGAGDGKLEMGNELVMYRHEQKFYHPAGIGLLIEDSMAERDLEARLDKIKRLEFERVGVRLRPDLVFIKNSTREKEAFLKTVRKTASLLNLNVALSAGDPAFLAEAVNICKARRPLIVWEGSGDPDAFIKAAKDSGLPVALTADTIDEAAQLTDKAKRNGVEEIVINIKGSNLPEKIQDFTYIRRAALKKNFRPLGYPVMALTESNDRDQEFCEAVSYVLKYASLVVVKNLEREFILPLLTARQDIYADPQKPVQVEPKIYEIGRVTKDSPVIVTTNFSITYFTVAGEVEASKVATYIVCCDSEGMSVLTAWAAEKFTAEKIAVTLKQFGIEEKVSHKRIVIPGYVSVLSGKLEELSGWKVSVGPREASGIPNYLRSWKKD